MGTIRTPSEADLPETADVVVIGGGVVGVATAFWTSRAGLDTVLVEKQEGLGTQTTAASAECFRAQFTEPAMVALAKSSIELFDNFYWAGVMLGPTAGRWTAELITGETKPEDNPLRPTRFAEGDYDEGASFLSGH